MRKLSAVNLLHHLGYPIALQNAISLNKEKKLFILFSIDKGKFLKEVPNHLIQRVNQKVSPSELLRYLRK
jgi:hypothetical protein